MILLLDTHVWLWAVEAPDKLGRWTKALLLKSGNDRLVSAISALEIARLCLDERMIFSVSSKRWIEDSTRDLFLQHVDIGYAIAVEAYSLPEPFHRDPVDRVLVATARSYQATLLTANERILA
jgi:PIN domain nuclease of toxin-antitoxin system